MKPLKNLLTILLILLPLSAHAWGVVVTSGGVAGVAGAGCTGVKGNNGADAGSFLSLTADRTYVVPVTLDCTGSPTSINFKTKYGNTNVSFCIYDDDGTDGAPGTRLWYGSGVATGNSSSVVTVTDTSVSAYTFASTGTYYIGLSSEGSGRVYETATTGGDWRRAGGTDHYPTPPETFGEPSSTGANNPCIWLVFP